MNTKNLKEFIVFEDQHIICINKKAGVLSQPGKNEDISVQKLLEIKLKHDVFILNRLDRPVSGLILFAKSKRAAAKFSAALSNPETKKTYYAIVEQKPELSEGVLENTLNKKDNKSYISSDPVKGKTARLEYTLIGSGTNYHFLKIILHTGRFHQIRSQMANIGCHIKGDVKYGARRSNKDKSIGLHAYELDFKHPVKKEMLNLKANFPEDNLWESLKQNIDFN